MKVANLKTRYPLLLSHLEEKGYEKNYIRSFKSEIKTILETESNEEIQSYDDYYERYLNAGLSESVLGHRRHTIGLIKQFDCEGKYPSKAHRYRFIPAERHDELPSDFMDVINRWELSVMGDGRKAASIATEKKSCIYFFSHLVSLGAKTLDKVTEKMVFSYFSEGDQVLRGYTTRCRIRRVLKACVPYFPDKACKKVLLFIPAIKHSKKNYPYLTEEETDKIMSVLTDGLCGLSCRDRAIGLLALLCGLRCCDIATLNIGDINWEKEKINIVQQKTGVALSLPFCSVVGNAIYDYIMEERPKTADEDHLFFVNDREVRPVSSQLYHISVKIMNKAGVRSDTGKKGFHLFRHRFGVMMFNKGVPGAVITASMGHVSPASLDAYLDSDLMRLKACGCSVVIEPAEILNHFPLGRRCSND
jgi:integrase